MFIIVGLGNPGEQYQSNRHNVGRMILEWLSKKSDFSAWKEEGKIKALVSGGKIGKEKVSLVLPNNFMNNSGKSLTTLIKSKKDLAKLVVVYDDLDLPLGSYKISFNKSSGGHNGLESIIKNLKSREFIRIRIGVSPVTPSGKIKKPKGEDAVLKLLLSDFKDSEILVLKKISKKVEEILNLIISDGKDKAMTLMN